MSHLSRGYKVSEMTSEVQQVVNSRGLDVDLDGHINATDVGRIEDELKRARSGSDSEILNGLLLAAKSNLDVPRGARDASQFAKIMGAKRPWDLLQTMVAEQFKGAQIKERVDLIDAIVNGRGYAWYEKWAARVNDPKEKVVLAIIETTPEHLRPFLLRTMQEKDLITKVLSALDGQEHTIARSFFASYVWTMDRAADVAAGMRDLGMGSYEEAVRVMSNLRQERGDAFAENVASQLHANGYFRRVLPFVYWSPYQPTCDQLSDVSWVVAQRAIYEAERQRHRIQFAAFLQVLPNGPTASALQSEFDQAHNFERLFDVFAVTRCIAEATSRREENHRPTSNNPVPSYPRNERPGSNSRPGGNVPSPNQRPTGSSNQRPGGHTSSGGNQRP